VGEREEDICTYCTYVTLEAEIVEIDQKIEG
jgi:hypothetical protein